MKVAAYRDRFVVQKRDDHQVREKQRSQACDWHVTKQSQLPDPHLGWIFCQMEQHQSDRDWEGTRSGHRRGRSVFFGGGGGSTRMFVSLFAVALAEEEG